MIVTCSCMHCYCCFILDNLMIMLYVVDEHDRLTSCYYMLVTL